MKNSIQNCIKTRSLLGSKKFVVQTTNKDGLLFFEKLRNQYRTQ